MEDVSINLQEEMASVDDQRHRQLNNNQYRLEDADHDNYDVDDEDYPDQIEMAQEALMGEADEADHEIEQIINKGYPAGYQDEDDAEMKD
jgi:hypothetical protein